MQTTILKQGCFIDMAYSADEKNHGNNSDKFTFNVSTAQGGQEMLLNGVPADSFSFTLVGPAEKNEFFEAVQELAELLARGAEKC
jgi:hypothetical protein